MLTPMELKQFMPFVPSTEVRHFARPRDCLHSAVKKVKQDDIKCGVWSSELNTWTRLFGMEDCMVLFIPVFCI